MLSVLSLHTHSQHHPFLFQPFPFVMLVSTLPRTTTMTTYPLSLLTQTQVVVLLWNLDGSWLLIVLDNCPGEYPTYIQASNLVLLFGFTRELKYCIASLHTSMSLYFVSFSCINRRQKRTYTNLQHNTTTHASSSASTYFTTRTKACTPSVRNYLSQK